MPNTKTRTVRTQSTQDIASALSPPPPERRYDRTILALRRLAAKAHGQKGAKQLRAEAHAMAEARAKANAKASPAAKARPAPLRPLTGLEPTYILTAGWVASKGPLDDLRKAGASHLVFAVGPDGRPDAASDEAPGVYVAEKPAGKRRRTLRRVGSFFVRAKAPSKTLSEDPPITVAKAPDGKQEITVTVALSQFPSALRDAAQRNQGTLRYPPLREHRAIAKEG